MPWKLMAKKLMEGKLELKNLREKWDTLKLQENTLDMQDHVAAAVVAEEVLPLVTEAGDHLLVIEGAHQGSMEMREIVETVLASL